MARHPSELNLALRLPVSGSPLRHRIADAIVEQIRTGGLRPGDALPSTRVLATELAVARSSVVEAYDELAAAGYVTARAGSGTRVAAGADAAATAGAASHVASGAAAIAAPPAPHRPPPSWDLAPGQPDADLISTTDWRRAWRAAAAAPVPARAAGPDGHAELRRALSGHLRRTRGIAAEPGELIIVPGVASALRTVAGAARLAGHDVAFEEPGYAEARRAFEMSGARPRSVAVDVDGLDPGSLRESDAAVYCTPAHQYPLGARLPVPRRAALVEWAAGAGKLLIEDDYDGEFRYDVSALPALRSVAGGRHCVAYVGTASKVLTPSVRLAWLLPPPTLRDAVAEVLDVSGESVCGVTALALARFIESGALTRHLARASRTYSARRTALVGALKQECNGVALIGVEAGLHLVLRLPDDSDDTAIAAALSSRGVAVPPLSGFFAYPGGLRGLVCGYALLPETQAGAVAAVIAEVLRSVPAG
ncbi:PLP-dependent aminotransferase family protein [Mycobacterium sp. 21AC1]|uniref:MocR-like pyridoxine biosynthesis transcription factor PdxR n=1 Tax=[Mycobacterium] appelbergii TaxID=2939269 RepID=UPI00293941C7|nr:PLP-dependent aminotransferase family protein [Mycobacterium sp. 21AC1]MDV3130241.1 PLP-dependent aminotransferase family protein [Mycobacterium sp. 21AC1]